MSLSQFWFQVTENCYEKNPLLWSLIIASTQQTKEITKKSFTAKLAKKLRAKYLRLKKLPTWKTACFSWGVALSSFCWINLEPCWSWLNSTTWSVSSRSCRFGYRLFLKLDAYYRAAQIIYLNVFKEIMRRWGGGITPYNHSLHPLDDKIDSRQFSK